MKARMTSRVTVMPKLESGEESPEKGCRNGTRAKAVAKWPASSDTSSATIGAGAVFTSGRLPIAMPVTLPRLDAKVNAASPVALTGSTIAYRRHCRMSGTGETGPAMPSTTAPWALSCSTSPSSGWAEEPARRTLIVRIQGTGGCFSGASWYRTRATSLLVAVLPERGSR